MEQTRKIELTEKQCDTLAIALGFAAGHFENLIKYSDNTELRDSFFEVLYDLYDFQDFLHPNAREFKEKYRIRRNGGEADEK